MKYIKEICITQFKNTFGLSLNDVINIEDLGAETNDDGIYHYINLINNDVYSLDTDDDIWLPKNLYKEDIVKRLNINF